ncbi:iron-containing alcohol dehydrogenase family protein [Caproicibacter sp.]|uniref:iron-containing alcohol dehydrogenase family protein n=1 Tax=Caproicibacter sp. TaxID=2814884 RepID=UPI00398A2DC5
MKDFTFKIPQDIVFGVGSLKKLPEILKKIGSSRVMVVSDHSLEKLGVVKKVTDICEKNGISSCGFLDVMPNPTVDCVNEAVKLYQSSGATSMIALGGGSPMDVAKAAGVVAAHGGKITDYEGAHLIPGPIVPIIAIPTTAGTGSEVTAFSVIVDKARNYKLTVFSYELIPRFAVLDPNLIMTLPPAVAASTGIDAMIHAIESYLSRDASPFSDAMAEKALSLIGANIRKFVACRQNEEAACAMMTGSMFAGIAFAWARLGNVHAMSHPVSAFFNVPHGVANAVILPTVLEYNALADDGRYEEIFNYIKKGNKSCKSFVPQMLVDEIRELLNDLSIPMHLSGFNVTEDLFPQMAEDAMKSGNIFANPRQSTQADIENLYRRCL